MTGAKQRGEDTEDVAAGAEEPEAGPEAAARTLCLRLVTAAPRTRGQLASALHRHGVAQETAEEVLARFEDVGLIDDAAFARAWVESRHAGRGLARGALARELRSKGVAEEVVDEALSRLDPADEEANARALAERKLLSTRGLRHTVRVRRTAGVLARRGYPEGLTHRVIRQALQDEGVDLDEEESM